MNLGAIWQLIKETFSEWSEDKVPSLAAALAYYTIFSIAPILIIAIGIASLVFGKEAAQGQITQQISGIIGQTGAQAIQEMIVSNQKTGAGIFATLVGVGALLFGATGLFAELHDSMNTIWEVKSKSGGGVLQTLRERFLSFAMVLGVGFLLLVSLVISAGMAALGSYISSLMPGAELIGHALNFTVSFLVISALFAMIFKILPQVKIEWRDVWIGAASTAFLFVIGKLLIGLYLGKSAVTSGFGAAGALVIVLLWVYYAAQIMFLGAEFTQVYARHYGSRIVAAADAEPLRENDKAMAEKRSTHPMPEKGIQPEALPWREGEHRPASAAGALWSLFLGIAVGFYYGLRGKKQTRY